MTSRTVIEPDYSFSATPSALVRILLPQRLVSEICADGGFGRGPVAADSRCLDPSFPCEEAEMRGAEAGERRRLAQRQQVVAQGRLGAGLAEGEYAAGVRSMG